MNSGSWFLLVWGVLALFVGGANAINPRMAWLMNTRMSRWQFKNGQRPEPSRAYLLFSRVIGALFVVAGIVALVVFFVQLSK